LYAVGKEGDGSCGQEEFGCCFHWENEGVFVGIVQRLPDPERSAVVGYMSGVVSCRKLVGLGVAHTLAVAEGEALILHLIDVAL
jgi:hypothetical protein